MISDCVGGPFFYVCGSHHISDELCSILGLSVVSHGPCIFPLLWGISCTSGMMMLQLVGRVGPFFLELCCNQILGILL